MQHACYFVLDGDISYSGLAALQRWAARRYRRGVQVEGPKGAVSMPQPAELPEIAGILAVTAAVISAFVTSWRLWRERRAAKAWNKDSFEKALGNEMLRLGVVDYTYEIDNFDALSPGRRRPVVKKPGKNPPCVIIVRVTQTNALYKVYMFRDGTTCVLDVRESSQRSHGG